MQSRLGLLIVPLLAGTLACSSRTSVSAFHLPLDGDAARGQVAFVQLGCNGCHEVSGADLPRPTIHPAVPVVLGGTVPKRISDAYLVTSIINPNYDLAPYPKEQITAGGHSRMPQYDERISVRQLTDVVAFMQAHYEVTRLPETYH